MKNSVIKKLVILSNKLESKGFYYESSLLKKSFKLPEFDLDDKIDLSYLNKEDSSRNKVLYFIKEKREALSTKEINTPEMTGLTIFESKEDLEFYLSSLYIMEDIVPYMEKNGDDSIGSFYSGMTSITEDFIKERYCTEDVDSVTVNDHTGLTPNHYVWMSKEHHDIGKPPLMNIYYSIDPVDVFTISCKNK